ncbi:MAG: 16S rRNA (cytidine(1402)-2'-O)-methyltransferase [Spirochaetales bacterium]|jgi:16S rRNA (cytidine1402-2'-O)-methyltransferase|nr:16S rRNA (cytidine(1402)-2'-O)-methyltransferase [Spirochaetales bacterium]
MVSLCIVATPIGNLKDISLRALDCLRAAHAVACEDTRHSLKLLNHYDIRKPLISCHGHNEEKSAERILALLRAGKDVAYISDAGTPGLSDPGQRLVRRVKDAGFPVIPLPGPCAFAALASVSGFTGKTLTFEGFLSPKAGRRRSRLRELLDRGEAFVLYESVHRILKLLADLADLEPERLLVVGREMTKEFEEYIEGAAGEIPLKFTEKNLKGEFSVLVSGRKKS